jgi:hypothetical protein
MAKTKSTSTCSFKGCKKDRESYGNGSWSRFCCSHKNKATINGFLVRLYTNMQQRVTGKKTKRPDLYLGLPILPRDVFYTWAKNHPDFLALYKRWFSNNFDRKLTPTINRMNSSKGYILGNIEWITNSQNCGLSTEVRKMKQKKAIYDLLGVNK